MTKTGFARTPALVCLAVHLACVVCLAQPAAPQAASPAPAAIAPDRPDFTDSPETVGRGVVQFESGVRWERDRDRVLSFTTPQILVRIGITRFAEVRVGGDGFITAKAGGASAERFSGGSDLEISAKVTLRDGGEDGLGLAVEPWVMLPTGSADFSSGGCDPGAKLAWSTGIGRGLSLSGNFVAGTVTTESGREWERVITLGLARGFGESWGAFWEGYGYVGSGTCACTLNAGVTRAFGPDLQVDLLVGRGVSGDSARWYVGAGIAMRRVPGRR